MSKVIGLVIGFAFITMSGLSAHAFQCKNECSKAEAKKIATKWLQNEDFSTSDIRRITGKIFCNKDQYKAWIAPISLGQSSDFLVLHCDKEPEYVLIGN